MLTKHHRHSWQRQAPRCSACVHRADTLGGHEPQICLWHRQTGQEIPQELMEAIRLELQLKKTARFCSKTSCHRATSLFYKLERRMAAAARQCILPHGKETIPDFIVPGKHMVSWPRCLPDLSPIQVYWIPMDQQLQDAQAQECRRTAAKLRNSQDSPSQLPCRTRISTV